MLITVLEFAILFNEEMIENTVLSMWHIAGAWSRADLSVAYACPISLPIITCMYVCIILYWSLNDHFLSHRDLIYQYIAEIFNGVRREC